MTTTLRSFDVHLLITAPHECGGRFEGAVMPDPDLLTLSQVAERLQVSRWTVYQLVWNGELHSVHIGRCHRIRRQDVDAYIERLGAGAA
jgi:excisionase family DNA binding protein